MEATMRRGETGYTFVAVLVLLALCMLGLSIAGPLWSDAVKREREQELKRVGALYATALQRYRDASPGNMKQYPQRLDALLRDDRYVGIQRYIRKLYVDPTNPGQQWEVVLDEQQRIRGIYSKSRPEWKFIAKAAEESKS